METAAPSFSRSSDCDSTDLRSRWGFVPWETAQPRWIAGASGTLVEWSEHMMPRSRGEKL